MLPLAKSPAAVHGRLRSGSASLSLPAPFGSNAAHSNKSFPKLNSCDDFKMGAIQDRGWKPLLRHQFGQQNFGQGCTDLGQVSRSTEVGKLRDGQVVEATRVDAGVRLLVHRYV